MRKTKFWFNRISILLRVVPIFIFLALFFQNCAPFSTSLSSSNLLSENGSCALPPTIDFEKHLKPMFVKNCVSCHSSSVKMGNLDLTQHFGPLTAQNREVMNKSYERMQSQLSPMPPSPRKRLNECEIEALGKWLGFSSTSCGAVRPGNVMIHRLNNEEYDNSVRDLLGVDLKLGKNFPASQAGLLGFDNDAQSLRLSPQLIKTYFEAASKISNEVMMKSRSRVVNCSIQSDPNCAVKTIRALATKSYRRPATDEEVERLLEVYKTGATVSFDQGIKLTLQAILVSPGFLFRRVDHPEPNNKSRTYFLNSYELASQLSYFLWSSMPDDALFADAANGTLVQPNVLKTQILRMLKDAKAKAFVDNFAGQWLGLRKISQLDFDAQAFPEYNSSLKESMKKEADLFFQSLIVEDRSIASVISADYTFMNEDIARLYGVAGITGKEFRRVTLPRGERAGMLTQPGLIGLHSGAIRSSPVKRGVFVLKQFLCSEPPPPPPGIPGLPSDNGTFTESAIRQTLADHRKDVQCASCHVAMDPIGLGFENYNALGRFRTKYNDSKTIDSSGQLPSGEKFHDVVELGIMLKDDMRFKKCVTKLMGSYAAGRELGSSDQCAVGRIASTQIGPNTKFSDLIFGIVTSEFFKSRSGEGETK